MTNIPGEAFKKYASKEISAEEMEELNKFAAILNKEAGAPPVEPLLEGVGKHIIRSLAGGSAMAGGAMGVGAAGTGLALGMKTLLNRMTFNSDLGKIIEVYPEIAEHYSDQDIRLAYQSMRTLNPTLARDPLVGGTLLQQILRNRDLQRPSAAPRFDVGVAADLFTAKPRVEDMLQQTLTQFAQKGMEGGFRGR
jgi:hypothetical protein